VSEEIPENVQRWTAKRRAALVVSILKGETTAPEAARKHGLSVAEIEDWKEKFLLGAENALRSKPKDEEALKDEQIKRLQQKVGELVLDMDILRRPTRGALSTGRRQTSEGRATRETRRGWPIGFRAEGRRPGNGRTTERDERGCPGAEPIGDPRQGRGRPG